MHSLFFPVLHSGDEHCIPTDPCHLCGSQVDFAIDETDAYFIQCPECGLVFGLPHGYSSRLDLVQDWNKNEKPEKCGILFEDLEIGTPLYTKHERRKT